MESPTWIGWPQFLALRSCPQQYLFCAGGPKAVQAAGAEVLPNPRRSQRREAWAEAITDFLTDFYQKTLWRSDDPPQAAADLMFHKLLLQLARARAGAWVLDAWDAQRMEGEAEVARAAGGGFCRTFYSLGLIGPRIEPRRVVSARLRAEGSEVLVSRPHLRIEREDGQLWLLSASFRQEDWDAARGCYFFPAEDREAALWDALVSYLSDGRVPDRLGVLPLRYPAGYRWEREAAAVEAALTKPLTPKTAADKQAMLAFLRGRPASEGVVWERCAVDNLGALAKRCETALGFLGGMFPARVGGWCSRCDFEECCGARVRSLQAKRKSRGSGPAQIPTGTIVKLGE